MKKTLLLGLLLTTVSYLWADELSVENFTINAGEEKRVSINLENEQTWSAFQFSLELPEGLSLKTKSNGDPSVTLTNRLKPTYFDEDEDDYIELRHTVNANYANGVYSIAAYSGQSLDIIGNSGAVLTITVVASDQVATGTQKVKLSEIKLVDGSGNRAYVQPNSEYDCTVNINTTVTTLGYASFSWPKALDFTNSGLTAYIATSCDGSSVQLESVTKVPANTGLILKGVAGSDNSYSLQTTDETPDNVSNNLLSSTATGTYTVASEDIYVLSNLDDGKPGFYLANAGINVGQYKAYLQYSGELARKGLTFREEATAIKQVVETSETAGSCFDMQGRRVSKADKGLYIVNGKKVIVK